MNKYVIELETGLTSVQVANTKKEAVENYFKTTPLKFRDKRAFPTVYKNTFLTQ